MLAEAGGGAVVPLAGEGDLAEVEEARQGEAVAVCLVFSRTGRTGGSDHPLGSEPAPMLPAPVSPVSGGELKSSAR